MTTQGAQPDGLSHTPTSHPGAVVDRDVVHDLLNPLTAVVGNLHLLDDLLRESGSPRVIKCLDSGLASAEELRDMMENLRYLMSVGGSAPATVAVDLSAVLSRMEEQINTRKSDKAPPGFEVRGGSPLIVRGNEKLLRRALEAMLRTVTRLGLRAEVVARREGDRIEARFVHHGRAIPSDLVERLFDHGFARVQQERGVKIDRARGLWFVSEVVKAHGGSIRYETAPDGGAFVIHFLQG